MSDPLGYLRHLLLWAGPVVLLQALGLVFVYKAQAWRVFKALLPPVFVVTAWLSAADHLAIGAGVWRFDDRFNLGVRIGTVPVEEILFFFLTNLLVAQGLALFGHRRLSRRGAQA